MADMMFQFQHPGATPPTIEQVQAAWQLRPGDLDPAYGVVPTDPRAGLYLVMVREDAAGRLEATLRARRPGDPAVGLFGNPPQESQGQPPGEPPR